MTAPIVFHDDRLLMADEEKFDLGLHYGSTKLRASYSKTYVIAQQGVPGQLWDRLAERDVQAHGESTPRRPLLDPSLNGMPLRWHIEQNIERRRPAMRAARAGSQE